MELTNLKAPSAQTLLEGAARVGVNYGSVKKKLGKEAGFVQPTPLRGHFIMKRRETPHMPATAKKKKKLNLAKQKKTPHLRLCGGDPGRPCCGADCGDHRPG